MRIPVLLVSAMACPVACLPAQVPTGPAEAGNTLNLLAALASENALDREIARRQLSLAKVIPETGIAQLLGSSNAGVVAAAASLLCDRRLATERLQRFARHPDAEIRRAVMRVATPADLWKLMAEDPVIALRVEAMYQLEDRGLLTDARLTGVMLSEQTDLRAAACRLIVYERSPFPIHVANKLLESPGARHTLLENLADRPRASSGPWLLHVLGIRGLSQLDRLLAIHSLPPDWIDIRMAREVLDAAVAKSMILNNRASSAAARFPPEIADRLVPAALAMIGEGPSIDALVRSLVRVTPAGERQVFDAARKARPPVMRDVSHWLSSRESKLIATYVEDALDAEEAFPPELVALAGPALRVDGAEKPQRIDKVVAVLEVEGAPSLAAFGALLEAEVFHPAMVAFAQKGVGEVKARRLYRLLKLSPSRLPLSLFQGLLAGEDVPTLTAAVHALARAPLDQRLEPRLLEFALQSKFATLRLAASRALVLGGSAAAGRRVFLARRADSPVIEWLIEAPRPWSHDLLQREREAHGAKYHRVLVALAKLGDRAAIDELVVKLPDLGFGELQEAQKAMGRIYKTAELERLARQHLVAKPLARGKELEFDETPEEERRGERIAWFAERRELRIEPLLTKLWRTDKNYQVRLAALRGLLARDSVALHSQLASLVQRPFGEDEEELAFEVVGSMSHPMTDKALVLLARILLLAPLTDPKREVRHALEQGYANARGAYPLIVPASVLLRRDRSVRPGRAFAAVAAQIGKRTYALNRQRLGLFLASFCLRPDLQADLGPVLGELILASPDRSPDFVGPAQWVLAAQADERGKLARAARLYESASKAFCRGVVPLHIQRLFCGDVDPANGRHPYAALSAQAAICRARLSFREKQPRAADRALGRARDLAEGDAFTIERIQTLRRAKRP